MDYSFEQIYFLILVYLFLTSTAIYFLCEAVLTVLKVYRFLRKE